MSIKILDSGSEIVVINTTSNVNITLEKIAFYISNADTVINIYNNSTGAGFDNSNLGGLYIGLSINGSTSASWTITQVIGEANW